MSEMRRRIRDLLEQGLSKHAIALRLGVAGSTVDYHVERLSSASDDPPPGVSPKSVRIGRRQIRTRERVAELLAQGHSHAEIARRLDISRPVVTYHVRRLGKPVDERCARRYDWAVIQEFYARGHSVRECQARFGFSRYTWAAAVKRGAVVPRPTKIPDDEYFAAGVYRNRHYVKKRLITDGIKAAQCEECGLTEWLGRPISFALHHVNGDRHDNRVPNLRLLCANCHSQTDTFSGRNGHRRPKSA